MNIRIRVVLTLGICLLALESLEGEQTGAPQIDPSKYKFLLGACEGRTSSYRNVYGVVSREVDLSVDNTARALLELGAALGQEQCPRSAGFGNITVYLYHGDPGTFSADKF
ncbi:MAG: hypothetical protein LC130_16715, partial [Bryobacterales bacterium]|nr:hypothetical protein [Bryobacterales bacterium]